MIYSLEELKQLKEIKHFTTRGNSKNVSLLEGGEIVKKSYHLDLPVQMESFYREIAVYRYLEECDYQFVPELFGVDEKSGTLYISYCGKGLKQTSDNMKRVKDRLKDLYKKTGLNYFKYGEKQWIIYWHNLCESEGEVYVIDFGSRRWRLDERSFHDEMKTVKKLRKALDRRDGNLYKSRRIAMMKKK